MRLGKGFIMLKAEKYFFFKKTRFFSPTGGAKMYET